MNFLLQHINKDIQFTHEDVRGDMLAFLDCALHISKDGCFNPSVACASIPHRRRTWEWQLFRLSLHQSYHINKNWTILIPIFGKSAIIGCPLEVPSMCLSVRCFRGRHANSYIVEPTNKRTEQGRGQQLMARRLIKNPPNSSFVQIQKQADKKPFHPMDKIPKAGHCCLGCTVQRGPPWTVRRPLHECIQQHGRASQSGQDSAVHLHLKDGWHTYEDGNVQILAREDRWCKRREEEVTCVTLEELSLNSGDGIT